MNSPATTDQVSNRLLKLVLGIVLFGVGAVIIRWTGTGVETVSLTVVGLSGIAGVVAGVGDDVETISNALERGQWVIVSLAVLFLFALPDTDASLSLLLGLCIGIGGGVVLATIGMVFMRMVRNH